MREPARHGAGKQHRGLRPALTYAIEGWLETRLCLLNEKAENGRNLDQLGVLVRQTLVVIHAVTIRMTFPFISVVPPVAIKAIPSDFPSDPTIAVPPTEWECATACDRDVWLE